MRPAFPQRTTDKALTECLHSLIMSVANYFEILAKWKRIESNG